MKQRPQEIDESKTWFFEKTKKKKIINHYQPDSLKKKKSVGGEAEGESQIKSEMKVTTKTTKI